MNFNKIGLVALSAGAIFMATSCNKPNTKVNEDEFKAALAFEGVDYLQVKMATSIETTESGQTTKQSITESTKTSPQACYMLSTDPDGGYGEVYATKQDNSVTYIARDKKDGDFKEGTVQWDDESRKNYFMTPQDIAIAFAGLDFKIFDYKNGAYVAEYSSEETSIKTKYSLVFSNKKLSKFVLDINMPASEVTPEMETKATSNFGYKKLTPASPKK